METILIKVYGSISDISSSCYQSIILCLEAWKCEACIQHEANTLTLQYEGIYFPCDEIIAIIQEHIGILSKGKVDCIDVELWTLTRHTFFENNIYKVNSASLNKALEKYMYI